MSTSNEPWGDPRITAYVMDQLTPTEAAQFEAEMELEPQLANAVDEARRITAKLKGFYAAMPTVTLDADRLAQITGTAATRRNGSGADSGYTGWRIVRWAVAASVLILAVALPLWRIPKYQTASIVTSKSMTSPIDEGFESRLGTIKPSAADRSPGTDRDARSDVALDALAADAPAEMRMAPESQSFPTASALMMESAIEPASEPTTSSDNALGAVTEETTEPVGDNANVTERVFADAMAFNAETTADSVTPKMSSRSMRPEEVDRGSGAGMRAMRGMSPAATELRGGGGAPGAPSSPLDDREFRRVSEYPLSALSIDVETASYPTVRTYLQNNRLPPQDAVRIQEMINYFDDESLEPAAIDGESSVPVAVAMTATVCPWNTQHRLVRVRLQAEQNTESLTETLGIVAEDAKVEIEFNPGAMSAYRLIGYENQLPVSKDFRLGKNDVGEIAAGYQATALYEVVPIESANLRDRELVEPTSAEMLTLKLSYKQPPKTTDELLTRALNDSPIPFDQADADFQFATSVAAFGMLLRGSPFAGSWTYDDVLRVAEGAIGSDPDGLRSEFVGLVRTAKVLTARE